jgi:hypothetical protein
MMMSLEILFARVTKVRTLQVKNVMEVIAQEINVVRMILKMCFLVVEMVVDRHQNLRHTLAVRCANLLGITTVSRTATRACGTLTSEIIFARVTSLLWFLWIYALETSAPETNVVRIALTMYFLVVDLVVDLHHKLPHA